jgi:hypothetical protein
MDEQIARAAKRTEWAARALGAASEDLYAAGARGLIAGGPAEVLEQEAERLAELAAQVAGLDNHGQPSASAL